jgi:hypothetical protein
MTPFDRKPVSERIAPAVVAALHQIDLNIHQVSVESSHPASWFDEPRLIAIGHSLGGNILAVGLKERMIELINHNDFKCDAENAVLSSPIGDLVVLLNPASEADNWIAIQRAVHSKVGHDTTSPCLQKTFSDRQPPIYMSLTATHNWPANDILPSDVASIRTEIPTNRPRLVRIWKERDPSEANDCTVIRLLNSEYRPYYDYDTATYALFPFYKWDFRPLAQTIDEYTNPDPYLCNSATFPPDALKGPSKPNLIVRVFFRTLAAGLRNFPFMNTEVIPKRELSEIWIPRDRPSAIFSTRKMILRRGTARPTSY